MIKAGLIASISQDRAIVDFFGQPLAKEFLKLFAMMTLIHLSPIPSLSVSYRVLHTQEAVALNSL